MLHFANPLGLWALLALPVIVVIHCLQERSRHLRVSTLFLLERVAPESASGSTFERLRQSLPFWMQILAALLLTWLLAEPRYVRKDSVQTVVVVLDSSASMSAFQSEAKQALQDRLGAWSRLAARTQWHLIESDPRKPTLYAGTEREALLAALANWHPQRGTHAVDEAFSTARRLVKGGMGGLIFVTDHKVEVPQDVALLAVGSSKPNTGWSGVEVTQGTAGHWQWKALLTNHSDTAVTRQWWVEREGVQEPVKTPQTLAPGQTFALSGELPPEAARATLVIEGDGFTLDDQLPMVRPKGRAVRVDVRAGSASSALLKTMLQALDSVELTSTEPDLTVAEIGEEPATDAILLDASAAEGSKLDAALVVTESHALTRDLNWSGLITTKPRSLVVMDSDAPLLWRGNEPLSLLRQTRTADGKAVKQLYLNWDLKASNAARLPALLVMLSRYVELVRSGLSGERVMNCELAESLPLPPVMENAKLTLQAGPSTAPFTGRAPETPGFFEVRAGQERLVNGAAHFADVREADLTKAESYDGTEQRRQEQALKETEADPLTPVWLLGVLGCFLTSWWSGKFETRNSKAEPRKPKPA